MVLKNLTTFKEIIIFIENIFKKGKYFNYSMGDSDLYQTYLNKISDLNFSDENEYFKFLTRNLFMNVTPHIQELDLEFSNILHTGIKRKYLTLMEVKAIKKNIISKALQKNLIKILSQKRVRYPIKNFITDFFLIQPSINKRYSYQKKIEIYELWFFMNTKLEDFKDFKNTNSAKHSSDKKTMFKTGKKNILIGPYPEIPEHLYTILNMLRLPELRWIKAQIIYERRQFQKYLNNSSFTLDEYVSYVKIFQRVQKNILTARNEILILYNDMIFLSQNIKDYGIVPVEEIPYDRLDNNFHSSDLRTKVKKLMEYLKKYYNSVNIIIPSDDFFCNHPPLKKHPFERSPKTDIDAEKAYEKRYDELCKSGGEYKEKIIANNKLIIEKVDEVAKQIINIIQTDIASYYNISDEDILAQNILIHENSDLYLDMLDNQKSHNNYLRFNILKLSDKLSGYLQINNLLGDINIIIALLENQKYTYKWNSYIIVQIKNFIYEKSSLFFNKYLHRNKNLFNKINIIKDINYLKEIIESFESIQMDFNTKLCINCLKHIRCFISENNSAAWREYIRESHEEDYEKLKKMHLKVSKLKISKRKDIFNIKPQNFYRKKIYLGNFVSSNYNLIFNLSDYILKINPSFRFVFPNSYQNSIQQIPLRSNIKSNQVL